MAGYRLDLDQGGSTLSIDPDQIIDIRAPQDHSVINEWEVDIPQSQSIESWLFADAELYYEDVLDGIDELLVRGRFEVAKTDDGSGVTTLRGRDVTARLDRGGEQVRYQAIAGWQAIEDYWDQYTSFDATVYEPPTSTIDESKTVQQGDTTAQLAQIFTPADTDPLEVANSELSLLQSAYHVDALEAGGSYVQTDLDHGGSADYVNGFAALLNATNDNVTATVTTEYDIPEEYVGVAVRGGGDDVPGISFELDNQEIESLGAGTGQIVFRWLQLGELNGPGWSNGTLEAGDHTIQVFAESVGQDEEFVVDWIVLYDKRYPYDFDNTTDGNDQLAGPALYPDAVTIETALHDDTFNVASASVAAGMSDTSGSQKIQVSNDGGTTWVPSDGSEQNTTTIDVDFSTVGTTVKGRVTLSRYGTQTSTPTQGHNGQSVSLWALEIDTNDLPVIDDREYVGSHFENLQQLHQDAGMRFAVEYDPNSLLVESFEAGQVTKTADWIRLDHSRSYDITDYANSIEAWGAIDEQTGSRLHATAKNQDEIDRIEQEFGLADGEIKAPPLFETRIDTEADLNSAVRTELAGRIGEDQLAGSVEIVPKQIAPGYAYDVPILDGLTLSLERVAFQDGGSPRGSLEFERRVDVAGRLAGLSGEVKRVKTSFK